MHLLIVTGLSGAGKSTALRNLEDMGYYCVDNLPFDMIGSFVDRCAAAEPKIDYAALGVDSRGSAFFSDGGGFSPMEDSFAALDSMDVSYEILFLDCQDSVLAKRYNETRRRHPICEDILDGIRIERELLGMLRDRANYIIDTTGMTLPEFSVRLTAVLGRARSRPFSLVIQSFGYKRGVPLEADIVLDVRFSPNPFYREELRSLSGLDKPVRDFVMSDPAVIRFLDGAERALKEYIPLYIGNGKHRLMVAVGCTGGRHRSVCCAAALYERLSGEYPSTIHHRDLTNEAEDIHSRFGGGR